MRADITGYTEILEHYCSDIIWVMDSDMRLRYISPSVELHSGFTVEEALSLPLDRFYTPQSVQIIRNEFERELARSDAGSEATTRRIELEAYNKDGSIDAIEVEATIVRDEAGNVSEIVGITRKITERKRAEQQRIDFTRALVHELKSPLTAITASCRLLLEVAEQDSIKRLANNIYKGAWHINERTDELLELARGELHMLELDEEKVEMTPFLEQMADEMCHAFADAGIVFDVDIPGDLPAISIDRTRIRQVVQNLLNNALKWVPREGRVAVRASVSDSAVTVAVEDSGPGIPEERQATIFQPYILKIAEGQHVKGLGLGLALAKIFIELHRGSIWVDSKVGQGSTFGFSLPLKR